MRKGKIACYMQILLSHNIFHSYTCEVCQNAELCCNGLKTVQNVPIV